MKVFFAISLSFLLAAGGEAAPITWTLLPLHITQTTGIPVGGKPATGTVHGAFTYDADTNTYSNWSFVFSGFSGFQTATLTPATSSIKVLNNSGYGCPGIGLGTKSPDPCFVFFYANSGGGNLGLGFSPQLTNAGGDR
jgi:hypothetical protein